MKKNRKSRTAKKKTMPPVDTHIFAKISGFGTETRREGTRNTTGEELSKRERCMSLVENA